MSDVNYSEVLFQSIDQIVEERLKQVQFDRTILCKVIEAYPDENKYWVNCEGLKLQVQSIDPKKTYSKDSMVYVLMPEGNYENVKVIIGGYSDKDIEKKVFNNSYDDFIPNQTFKFDNPITFQLSDIDTPQEIASSKYIPIQYDQEYDYVGVEWAMTTYSLFDAGINSGKYTLEIVFYNVKNEPIISYPIESSSIYGNPYSLSEEFAQYNLFPYSKKLNNCNSFKIRLYQGIQKDNNPEEIIDKFNDKAQDLSITLNYLHLSVGYSKANFVENQTLNLKKGDSLNYKTNDSNLKRTLYLDWRVKDKEANEQIFNYNNLKYSNLINKARIYWLKYHENIGYKSTQIIKDYTNIDGLYNWEIISTNSFEYNLKKIDTDYQIDQYKVFIVYDSKNAETEDDSDTLTNYKFTNTIIFENLDIAAIQPGSSNSDNNSNDLKFTLNEGNTGVYNVYGLDGRMSDSSKGGPYTITVSLFDSLQDKIKKVEWIFPSSNTMIIDDRSANWDSLSTNKKLKVQYRIKNMYYPSATQNIIQCKVTLSTGEIRNGSISFEFGQLGNQGTNYAFNIDFIGKNYLTNGENEKIQVKATLSNQNGEEVLLEDFINNLEWSWLFTTDGKVIDKDSTTEITSLSNIVCSKYQNNIVKLYLNNSFEMSEYNYSILQAKLKGYNTGDGIKADLTSYLCIPVAAADTDQIKPRSIQGATTIVYDSLGTSTSHSTEYYEVINDTNNYIDELEWNLSSQIAGYTGFPDLGKYQKKEEDSDKTITKYKIKPSSYVPLTTPPVSIIAKKNNSVIWNQPILIIQNTWFNETINEWDGVLKINEKNGSILSPLLIAGTKGSNNLFTGVTVGQLDTGSTTTNRTVNGVYGFKDGKARFWLNQDAEFYVGTGENKNIYFDANGNFSIVAKSFDFRTPDEIPNKLILSSTNQEFQIGNENSYLKFYTPEGESQKKFEIKANDFEFNSTNYNGFNMRVGKEGFYVGAEDEYISFEKEDGGFSRTLKISANNFDFKTTDNTLRLSSKTGEFYISDGKNYLQFQKEQKEYKEGETVTRSSVFKIKANEFEFNNDGYDSFDLRVSKTGFYVGTENEYISLEKELKEDGTTNYYRTLKIKAKEFDFTNDTIGLKITNNGLTIGHIPKEDEENSNYISLDPYGNLTMNLDNFNLETDHLKLSSNNGGEFKVGNNNYYLKFGGSYSTGLDIKTKNFILDTPTLKIDTTAISNNGFVLEVSGRGTIAGMQLSNGVISNVVGWNENNNLYSGYSCGLSSAFDYSKGRDIFLWVGAHRNSAVYRPANEWTDLWLDEISNNNWNVDSPHWGFSVKENIKDTASFYVTWDGVLHAKNAYISGQFTKTDSNGNTVQVGDIGGDLIFGSSYNSGQNFSAIKCTAVNPSHRLTMGVQKLQSDSESCSAAITYLHPYGQQFGEFWISSGYTDSSSNYKSNGSSLILQAGRLYGSVNQPMSGFARISLIGNRHWDNGYISEIACQAEVISFDGTTIHQNSQSDSRLKYDIETYDERYNILFDNLKPVRYKYYHGTSNRYHTGFIAQDIVTELENAGLTTQDLAAVFKVQLPQYKDTLGETWQLRRDELVSLNTWQIQKLKTRVTELENEIKEIKQRYEI